MVDIRVKRTLARALRVFDTEFMNTVQSPFSGDVGGPDLVARMVGDMRV